MKHLSEEELILLYYREPGVSGEHLRECVICRQAAESLAGTLNLCNEWAAAEPPSELARSVWAQLAPQMWDRRFRLSMRLQTAFAVALVAVMLVVAFTAGRASKPARLTITAGLSKQARQRILEISLADHLDRAGMLLTEISNATYTGAGEFAPERGRAQDLVDEGRLMRQTLSSEGQSATLSLLDEVERCMLEIANSPDQITPGQIERLQHRVASGSLIFEVRVTESNLRKEGQRT